MSLVDPRTLLCCPYCTLALPPQDLCWLHEEWWYDDDPRPCRLCCPVCQEDGESAEADVPGTVIWPVKETPHEHA